MGQVIDRSGLAQEFSPNLDHLKAAYAAGVSLPQYLNNTVDTDSEKFGTPFEQLLASNGLFLKEDKATGLKPPSIKAVLDGTVDINMGSIVRPDGSSATGVSGRLLFAAVIGEMIESELASDYSSYEGTFNRMVATTTTYDSPRVDIPIINLTAPQAKRSYPVAQGAEPPANVSITLSEKSFRLPTFTIGMEISTEALKATTLDLVGIAMREQANRERISVIDEGLTKMVSGDTDLGITALSSSLITAYDSSIASNGVCTQKAWIKALRQEWKQASYDWCITDIDTYLAIEGRTGRPTVQNNAGSDERLNSLPTAANSMLPDQVNFFLVDSTLLGANTLVFLDSRKAVRRAVYSGAEYSAVESFVLRKIEALRVDWSLSYFRLFDAPAWKKITLTTA